MKRRRGSLETRLLVFSFAWIVLALGLAAFFLAGLYRTHVEREHAERIQGYLEELAATVEVDQAGTLVLQRDLSDPAFRRPYSGLYWEVTSGGAVILRSRSLWDWHLDATGPIGNEPATLPGPEGQQLRVWSTVIHFPRHAQPVTLRVAADDSRIAAMASSFGRTLAVSLVILAAGLFACVFVQIRFGLAPLRALGRALTRLREGDAERIQGDYPTEIGPLVDDLNSVLHENRELLARARAQAGNLAHALKTPLAVIRNSLRPLAGEPAAETIGVEVERMSGAIERHLVRARAGSLHLQGRYALVDGALEDVVRAVRRMYGDAITFAVDSDSSVRFRGDIADLQEMAGNLLENAAKWARSRVVVTLRSTPQAIELLVEDDGPGIPVGRRAEAIRRGVRLDSSRPGTGLGLQIVDELCHVYSGSLTLGDSPLGGLSAKIALPAS